MFRYKYDVLIIIGVHTAVKITHLNLFVLNYY